MGPRALCSITHPSPGRVQVEWSSPNARLKTPDVFLAQLGVDVDAASPQGTITIGKWSGALNLDGHAIEFSDSEPWQWLVSCLSILTVLELQGHLMCFHAAALDVGGAGVAIMGPSGSGKTTLSLALTDRGHRFLSDEVAAVDRETGRLRPFLRAALVTRDDPSAGRKRRVHPSRMAAAVDGVPLRHVVFIRGRGDTPGVESCVPSFGDLGYVTPMAATTPGSQIIDILKLLNSVRCHYLDAGTPDATARAIEDLVEA